MRGVVSPYCQTLPGVALSSIQATTTCMSHWDVRGLIVVAAEDSFLTHGQLPPSNRAVGARSRCGSRSAVPRRPLHGLRPRRGHQFMRREKSIDTNTAGSTSAHSMESVVSAQPVKESEVSRLRPRMAPPTTPERMTSWNNTCRSCSCSLRSSSSGRNSTVRTMSCCGLRNADGACYQADVLRECGACVGAGELRCGIGAGGCGVHKLALCRSADVDKDQVRPIAIKCGVVE